jgi:protein-L-isoaspartate(D-aspartate) O-methyltransferase
MSDLVAERRRYAEALREKCGLRSANLVRALATVPRERYLGPGPWDLLAAPAGLPLAYRATPDADPIHLYQDVLVAIDSARHIHNGQPSFLAWLIDALAPAEGTHVVHVGCGTGYYTAILAEMVGPRGRVTAIDVDPTLAARARENLAPLAQVTVVLGDGAHHDPGPADAILVNAGVTHPAAVWLDRLRPGGRLALPLTTTAPIGTLGGVFVIRREASGYAAACLGPVGIFGCIGGREPEAERLLASAIERGGWETVRSVRRDRHEPEPDCWLHGDGFCFSRHRVTPA